MAGDMLLNLCTPFSPLLLTLLPHLHPLLTYPNCSSPRELALVFADYLRSHFSVFQPKALRSRARATFPSSRRATYPEESRSSFALPSYILFLQSERHLLLLPCTKWESLLTHLLSSSLSLTSCVSKLFERIILSRLFFFLESITSFSYPARPVSILDGLLSIKFWFFHGRFRMGLTILGRILGLFLLQLTFPRLLFCLSSRPFP